MKSLLLAAVMLTAAAAPARIMVVAGNPVAAQTGLQILKDGGTAADAAIAVQAVLGLVEPQSSGPGGGTLLLYYDAKTRQIGYYDGRETAPAAGGHAVGVPGTMALLDMLYQAHGHIPWADLFAPAARMAAEGFAVSPRLAAAIRAAAPQLARQPAAKAYFLAHGVPAAGTILKNPAYAASLRQMAANGAAGLMRGPMAADMAATIRAASGLMTADDIAAYQPGKRDPVCVAYRRSTICGPGAPSTGGRFATQTLGMLAHFDLLPRSAGTALLILDAERLAAADRAGDAALLNLAHALPMTTPSPKLPPPEPGTSAVAIVDAAGNAVAFTSTLNSVFGSLLLSGGFVLNDALAALPAAPGARPATSMTPIIVLDSARRLVAVLASAGSGNLPALVVQPLLAVLDWRQDPAHALALGHIGSTGARNDIEAGSAEMALAPLLAARGEKITLAPMPSASVMIEVTAKGLAGAADPRRDGAAFGE